LGRWGFGEIRRPTASAAFGRGIVAVQRALFGFGSAGVVGGRIGGTALGSSGAAPAAAATTAAATLVAPARPLLPPGALVPGFFDRREILRCGRLWFGRFPGFLGCIVFRRRRFLELSREWRFPPGLVHSGTVRRGRSRFLGDIALRLKTEEVGQFAPVVFLLLFLILAHEAYGLPF
jgi:hypothetical protein